VYHGGKPETGHQLVEALDKDIIGLRNKMGQMQWQHTMTQLAECMQSNGGHSKMCFNNTETYFLCLK
jgi:hypothetical protein